MWQKELNVQFSCGMDKRLKTIVENISYKTCIFKSGLYKHLPGLQFCSTFLMSQNNTLVRCWSNDATGKPLYQTFGCQKPWLISIPQNSLLLNWKPLANFSNNIFNLIRDHSDTTDRISHISQFCLLEIASFINVNLALIGLDNRQGLDFSTIEMIYWGMWNMNGIQPSHIQPSLDAKTLQEDMYQITHRAQISNRRVCGSRGGKGEE